MIHPLSNKKSDDFIGVRLETFVNERLLTVSTGIEPVTLI